MVYYGGGLAQLPNRIGHSNFGGEMKVKGLAKAVPRTITVTVPDQLLSEALAVSPHQLRQNLSRLVTLALRGLLVQQKERTFEKGMARMASEAAIRAECAAIVREFEVAEADGLQDFQ